MRGVVWLPRQGGCRWCGLLNGLGPSGWLEETFTKPMVVSFVGHLDGRDFRKKSGDFKW